MILSCEGASQDSEAIDFASLTFAGATGPCMPTSVERCGSGVRQQNKPSLIRVHSPTKNLLPRGCQDSVLCYRRRRQHAAGQALVGP